MRGYAQCREEAPPESTHTREIRVCDFSAQADSSCIGDAARHTVNWHISRQMCHLHRQPSRHSCDSKPQDLIRATHSRGGYPEIRAAPEPGMGDPLSMDPSTRRGAVICPGCMRVMYPVDISPRMQSTGTDPPITKRCALFRNRQLS